MILLRLWYWASSSYTHTDFTLFSLFGWMRRENETHRINNFPIGRFWLMSGPGPIHCRCCCGVHLRLKMSSSRGKKVFYSFYTSNIQQQHSRGREESEEMNGRPFEDEMISNTRNTQQHRNSYTFFPLLIAITAHRWTSSSSQRCFTLHNIFRCWICCQRPMLFPLNINLHSLSS